MVPAHAQTLALRLVSRTQARVARTAPLPLDDGRARRSPGSPTSPDPGRSCADRPSVPGLGDGRHRRPARSTSQPDSQAPSTALRRLTPRRRRRPPRAPRAMSATPPARKAIATSGRRVAAGQDAHRLGGSRVVSTSGRPSPAVIGRAAGPSDGHAEDHRHARRPRPARPATRTGVAGRSRPAPGRARSAAVPTDSRGTTTSPSSRAAVVDRDRLEPLADLERHRSRPSSNVGQPVRPRSWSRVRRKTSGRWAASSNSSSVSIRPLDPDIAGRAGGERERLGHGGLGRRRSRRPTR